MHVLSPGTEFPAHSRFAPWASLARLASTKASAENVKLLRQQTSLSIMLCRKALDAAQNDLTAAMKWLEDNEQARAEYVFLHHRCLEMCSHGCTWWPGAHPQDGQVQARLARDQAGPHRHCLLPGPDPRCDGGGQLRSFCAGANRLYS